MCLVELGLPYCCGGGAAAAAAASEEASMLLQPSAQTFATADMVWLLHWQQGADEEAVRAMWAARAMYGITAHEAKCSDEPHESTCESHHTTHISAEPWPSSPRAPLFSYLFPPAGQAPP